jgi:hypothetical protein
VLFPRKFFLCLTQTELTRRVWKYWLVDGGHDFAVSLDIYARPLVASKN